MRDNQRAQSVLRSLSDGVGRYKTPGMRDSTRAQRGCARSALFYQVIVIVRWDGAQKSVGGTKVQWRVVTLVSIRFYIDFGMKNVKSVVIKQQKFTAKNACPGAFKYFWRCFLGLIFSVNKSILYRQYWFNATWHAYDIHWIWNELSPKKPIARGNHSVQQPLSISCNWIVTYIQIQHLSER